MGISLVMLEVHYGLGRHTYYFQDYKFIGFLKYNYIDWVQVFITLAICKISICLFLLRISKFDKYRRILWGMIAFLVLSHLPLTLLYILQCVPAYKVWYQQVPGTCFSMVTVEKIVIVQGGEFDPFSVGTALFTNTSSLSKSRPPSTEKNWANTLIQSSRSLLT